MTHPTDLAALAARLRTAAPPAVAPPTFPTPQIGYAVHDTSVGRLLVARRGDDGPVIASLYLQPADEAYSAAGTSTEEAALIRIARSTGPRILRRPAAFDDVRRELDSYLTGASREFTVPLELTLAHRAGRQPAVHPAALPSRGRRLRRPHGVCRWAGRQGAAAGP